MLLDFKFRYQFRRKTKDGFKLKFAIGSIQLKSSKVKYRTIFNFSNDNIHVYQKMEIIFTIY